MAILLRQGMCLIHVSEPVALTKAIQVFEPHSTQSEIFEDISQLAQSCIDGYNVCIFAYGQTGSGKSFTMEGGLSELTKGMIPRAVEQVFQVAEGMRKKGWEYKMEGQFLEIVGLIMWFWNLAADWDPTVQRNRQRSSRNRGVGQEEARDQA